MGNYCYNVLVEQVPTLTLFEGMVCSLEGMLLVGEKFLFLFDMVDMSFEVGTFASEGSRSRSKQNHSVTALGPL